MLNFSYERRALRIAEANWGNNHASVAEPLRQLIRLLDFMGERDRAEALRQRAQKLQDLQGLKG